MGSAMPGYPGATGAGAAGAVSRRPVGGMVPRDRDGGLGSAIGTAVGFLVLIWVVFFIDQIVFLGDLRNFGVQPRDTAHWWGIFTAPLLHENLAHLMANSVPGALFAGLIALTSKRLFWQVTILVTVVGGGLTWLFGGINTVHIGASGLIYGWLAFLLVRGFVNRNISQITLGIILAFMYSGLIWGVLPTQMGVSWQMHLFGAFGGMWAALMFKRGRRVGV